MGASLTVLVGDIEQRKFTRRYRCRLALIYWGVKLVEQPALPTVTSTFTRYPMVGLPMENMTDALPPPSVAAVKVWSVVL
jgi:hypothetical protein